MSYLDLKSNKKGNKDNVEEKKHPKKTKNKILFNTIADLEKFNHYKTKKISKCKSSSVIIQKRKNSEKKKHIFIPINLKGPIIKTNNAKKKISYNKSTSELFNDRYVNFNNKINNNDILNLNMNKSKKNSQHNTINYIINNLSSKKKDSAFNNKFNEIKGINKSIIPANNNNNTNSNNNNFNNNNNNIIYEELKKENEKLLLLFNEKIKDNKKYKNKINYLENKNEQV